MVTSLCCLTWLFMWRKAVLTYLEKDGLFFSFSLNEFSYIPASVPERWRSLDTSKTTVMSPRQPNCCKLKAKMRLNSEETSVWMLRGAACTLLAVNTVWCSIREIYSVSTYYQKPLFLMCMLKGEYCRWRRDPSAGMCILCLYSSFIFTLFHFKSQTFPSSSHSWACVHSSLVCLCFWKVKGRRHGGKGREREKKTTRCVTGCWVTPVSRHLMSKCTVRLTFSQRRCLYLEHMSGVLNTSADTQTHTHMYSGRQMGRHLSRQWKFSLNIKLTRG